MKNKIKVESTELKGCDYDVSVIKLFESNKKNLIVLMNPTKQSRAFPLI